MSLDGGSGNVTGGQLMAILGGVLAGIGAFLPWIEFELLGASRTRTGIDGDGTFTLILGVVVVLVVLATAWRRRAQVGTLVVGLLVLGLSGMYISDPTIGVETSSVAERELLEAGLSVGIGLYVTAIGGLLMSAGGAVGLVNSPSGTAASASD